MITIGILLLLTLQQKKACENIHIQYSYDDNSIWVVNSLYTKYNNLVATAQVYSIDGKQLHQQSQQVSSVPADGTVNVFTIPLSSIKTLTTTFFVSLKLTDNSNKELSNNFYWLSTKPDVPDWSNSDWKRTPCKSWADYTMLKQLPSINLKVQESTLRNGDEFTTTVNVTNPSNAIAFFIEVELLNGDGSNVWPIFWSDNYFSILPNQAMIVTARYNATGVSQQTVTANLFNNNKW